MREVYLTTYQGKTIIVKNSQQDVIDNNTLLKEYSNYFKFQNHNNIWSHKRRLIGVGICSKRKFIKLSWNSYKSNDIGQWKSRWYYKLCCRDIKMRDFFDNGEHPYESVDDEDIKEQKRNAHSIYRLLNFTLINKVVHLNLI
ncbi:unnamed protein product [Rhizophagus irregularis]|nr:unnamed protein product [Rhizophagus irregularis]